MTTDGGVPKRLTIDGEVTTCVECADRDGPLAPLLDAAVPRADADHATVHSADGAFTASIPLDELRRATIVDGRLQVPDAPTRCWLVKDVVRLEVTAGKQPDSVDERAERQQRG
jgi:hypothetical protein